MATKRRQVLEPWRERLWRHEKQRESSHANILHSSMSLLLIHSCLSGYKPQVMEDLNFIIGHSPSHTAAPVMEQRLDCWVRRSRRFFIAHTILFYQGVTVLAIPSPPLSSPSLLPYAGIAQLQKPAALMSFLWTKFPSTLDKMRYVVEHHKQPPTVDQCRQYQRQIAEKGTTKKDCAISTKTNIRGVKTGWK